MSIVTVRYMWRVLNSENVMFKIVTDTVEGHSLFVNELLKIPDLISAGSEYLHEYDCSRVGVFEKIYNKED